MLTVCNEYQPSIELDQLPCGGCTFCTQARTQWETFEKEIDDVRSIAIRRISPEEGPCNWLDTLSTKEIWDEQMKDPDLKCIISWFLQDYEPSTIELQLSSPAIRYYWLCRSQLQMQNEALYYYWEDPISRRLLLVIPNSMKNQALELCHNLPISGHMGQTKTLLKLKQHVIWYKISVDCKLCQIL